MKAGGKIKVSRRTPLGLLIILSLLLAVILGGCGGVNDSLLNNIAPQGGLLKESKDLESFDDYSEKENTNQAEDDQDNINAGTADSANSLELLEEKLVYTAILSIETLEFDQSHAQLLELIKMQGGIVELQDFSDDSSLSYRTQDDFPQRNLNLTARIPTANYDSFMGLSGDIGHIRSCNTNVENISQRYYDTGARIESLRVQEERLLGMMEQAGTIEEMIRVEGALSEVQYEIDHYTTELKYMDQDVAYSTITVQLSEVYEYTSTPAHRLSFGERFIKNAGDAWGSFLNVMENLLALTIYLLPYAIFLGLLAWGVKRWRKWRQEKKAVDFRDDEAD